MKDIAILSDLPAPRGPRRLSRPIRTAAAIVVVCSAVAAAIVLCWPRTTTVKVFTQPGAVVYSDDSTHIAALKHVRAPLAALRPWADNTSDLDHYEIYLGRDPGGGYGHYVRLDATDMDPTRLIVEWKADGAWLDFQSGHRVFVPATYFIGGR
jgi:hypothetical protein